MKRLTVPTCLMVLLFVVACDQSPTTSKPEAEKPGTTQETKPAETPKPSTGTPAATPEKPASATQAPAKKTSPCKADRATLCPDEKNWNDVVACFKQNKDKLSSECRAAVKLD